MEVQKKRSKGGFFNLFDWNGKSRKRLFSNNAELPAEPQQQKENVENISMPRLDKIELDGRRANSNNRGISDLSCASSVTSDDRYGSRAPGVVARLMGLDSLPASNVGEPSPFFGTPSIRVQHDRSTPKLLSEHDILQKHERNSWNSVGPRNSKIMNLPIERFQTEVLPPKSAKSIPITHHKLLSPIKSPGFIRNKNVDYVMEAAAKIIESSPKATAYSKVQRPIGSPSVPLRIRDLKQKMEAAHVASTSRPQKVNEASSLKNVKGQPGALRRTMSNGNDTSISNSLKNKGKSVSHQPQAKANKQSDSVRNKEANQIKLGQSSSKSQVATQRIVQKRTGGRSNNVLRQNNQKQNCTSSKYGSGMKNSVPKQQGSKLHSPIGPGRREDNKAFAKSNIAFNKVVSVVTDSEIEKAKNIIPPEKHCNGVTDNRKSGMDVVSFTFTSPVKKKQDLDVQPSGETVQRCKISLFDDSSGDNGKKDPYIMNSTSFPSLNVIGGDALSILLEQKLKELAIKVESTHCNEILEETSDTSMCSSQTLALTVNEESTEELGSSGSYNKARNESGYGHISSALVVEHSSACGSSSNIIGSTKHTSSSQTHERFDCNLVSEYPHMEMDADLSDSASSSLTEVGGNRTTCKFMAEIEESVNWERDYIRDILKSTILKLEEFALGQATNMISPDLFERLGTQHNEMESNEVEFSMKLWQKVLFDCVSECIDVMCGEAVFGQPKFMLLQRKEYMVEELCKEISAWQNMCIGDLMVDELVEKDMNTKHGKWVVFDSEATEEGIVIEEYIFNDLVDELVADFLLL